MKNTSPVVLLALMTLAGHAIAQAPTPAAPASPAPAAPAPAAAPAKPMAPAKPDGHEIPSGPQAGPVHPANAPLKFETTIHDYGKIPDNKPVSFVFNFKNVSNKVINIPNVQASCGCTNVQADKQVQPGAESKITTTFNPQGRNGREVKTITVYLDDPECPQLALQTIAEVQRRIIVEPIQVWMGEVPFKTKREQSVTITGRAENFDVTKIEVGGTAYKGEIIGRDKVDVGGEMLNRVTLKVEIDDGVPIGRMSGNMVVTTTDPQQPTVNVALLADVTGELRITPPSMGIRMSGPSESFFGDVYLENREAKAFAITSVEFEPAAGIAPGTDIKPIVDVTAREPGSKAAYRVRLMGTTPANVNDLRGSVKIGTNVKDQALITIPVSAFMVAQPATPQPNLVKPQAMTPPTQPMPNKLQPAPASPTPGGSKDDLVPPGPIQTVNPEKK